LCEHFIFETGKTDHLQGTAENLHIWNDMNEPSVFDTVEITMPKDLEKLSIGIYIIFTACGK
jgi:alpha-glucosidase (family GH31 glycosyl hydrolase)